MNSEPRSKTGAAIRKLAASMRRHHPPRDTRPLSLDVLEERIRGLQQRVDELTIRVNALLFRVKSETHRHRSTPRAK